MELVGKIWRMILFLCLFILVGSFLYKVPLPVPVASTDISNTCNTTDICIYAKDASYVSPIDIVSDTTSDGGTVIHSNTDLTEYAAPEITTKVNFSSTGTWYVWYRYKNGGTFMLALENMSSYAGKYFGILPDQANYGWQKATNLDGSPKTLDVQSTGAQVVYHRLTRGTTVDCIYFSKDANATPACPTAAPFVPDYTIDSYNSITVNHVLAEDEWANAPNVSFATNASDNTVNKFTLLWNDGANRVCGAVQVADSTIYTSFSWPYSDHLEVLLSPGTSKTPTNAQTVKYAINADCSGATPQVDAYTWDSAFGGFPSTSNYNASMSASCNYAGGIYTIEWCGNIPWNVSPGEVVNFDALVRDNDNAGTTNDALAIGTAINSSSSWGTAQFVSAVPPSPPPDTTPPSCTGTTVTNITQTSMSIVVQNCTDNQTTDVTATFQWGTSTGNYNLTDSNNNTVTVPSGGSPTLNLGVSPLPVLACGTTYYFSAVVKDALGNSTNITEWSQTTSACSGFYISPSGNDSNTGTSVGSPKKTFATGIKSLCNTTANCAGKTIWLANGTYTKSTTGLPVIDCNNGWANGTSSAYITIQAANERQAYLQSDGSMSALEMANCHYWNIIGLCGSSADNKSPANGGTGQGKSIFQVQHDDHINLKRLLGHTTNRCFNEAVIDVSWSTNMVIEESEAYQFHRYGILPYNANGITSIRNYTNGRNYTKSTDSGCTATTIDLDANGSDGGQVTYNALNVTIENGISENDKFQDFGNAPCANNYNGCGTGNQNINVYGSIAMQTDTADNNTGCVNIQGNDSLNIHANTAYYFENFLAVGCYRGGWNRGWWESFKNTTFYGGVYGYMQDNNGGAAATAGKNRITTMVNTMLYGATSTPISVAAQDSCTLDYVRAASFPNPSICTKTSTTTTVPTLIALTGANNCVVYVPATSNMHGIGLNGDIGANIIYEYVNGVSSSSNPKVWCQSGDSRPNCLAVGQFAGCGALVSGINDNTTGGSVATQACRNVNVRLNLKADGSGCPIP